MTNTKWLKQSIEYGACNVERNYEFYMKFLLSKLHMLFLWDNLPDSIDETFLNNNLFLNGNIGWTKFGDKLYALNGNLSGVNEYYYADKYIIANPVLNSKEFNIGKDGVVMYNDACDKNTFNLSPGLFQLLSTTATMLADNVVSINTAQINTRVQAIVTADNPAQRNTAEIAMKALYSGKPYTVMEQNMIDKINVNPLSRTPGHITELTELQQYIMGTFYANIGIKMNSINKRERLITDEINSIDTYLGVTLETMLNSRQKAVEEINSMFGTDIKVSINPLLRPLIEESNTEDKIDEQTDENANNNAEDNDNNDNNSIDNDNNESIGNIGESLVEDIKDIVEEIVDEEVDDNA